MLIKFINELHNELQNRISKQKDIEQKQQSLDRKINDLLEKIHPEDTVFNKSDSNDILNLKGLIEQRLKISSTMAALPQYRKGYTLLHVAARYNWMDIAEKAYAIAPDSINKQTMYAEYTPLQLAARLGNKQVLEFLLNQSYEDKANQYGESLIHAAVKNGNSDILALLNTKNVKIDNPELRATTLSTALESGHLGIAKSLIDAMQINELENSKYAEAILLSLAKCNKVDLLESDFALREEVKNLLVSLINKGLKINGQEKTIYSLNNDKAELIRIFFEVGLGMPDVKALPFIGIAANGEDKLLAVFLDNLSKIDKDKLKNILAEKDKHGNTAMHYALKQSRYDFLKVLLKFELGDEEKATAIVEQYKELRKKINRIHETLSKLSKKDESIKVTVDKKFTELQEEIFFDYSSTKEFDLNSNTRYISLLEIEKTLACQFEKQTLNAEVSFNEPIQKPGEKVNKSKSPAPDKSFSMTENANLNKRSENHKKADYSFILKVIIGVALLPVKIVLLLKGLYHKIFDSQTQYRGKEVQGAFFEEKKRLEEDIEARRTPSTLRLFRDASNSSTQIFQT